jgi:hypothetical protein
MTPWTTHEIARLRLLYGKAPFRLVRDALPGRSEGAIRQQAHYNGLTEPLRAWTEDETQILRAMYPVGGWRACKSFIDRSRKAIIDRAQLLGVACEWGRERAAPLLRHKESHESV